MNDTFEGIIEAEHGMVLTAVERYGVYFTHAVEMLTLMNNLVSRIDRPERFLFVAFLSHVRKHLTLALLSAVRRHHVQMGMNLRQALESSAWAAYALAYEDTSLFYVQDARGHANVPQNLSNGRNRWLEENYPVKSEEILRLKNRINESTAHANVVYAFGTFGVVQEEQRSGFTTSYFDADDDFRIRIDLVMVANFAMGMIDLFGEVNQTYSVFQAPENFAEDFRRLIAEHNQMRTELGSHERFRESRLGNE